MFLIVYQTISIQTFWKGP